ncbi:MAG: peptidoglycan DD-metalloendopeptidase family protein [Anaerovoracaceae bacterium]|jgi:murein DD-endopeptidase MepM/ murein hydrolase activator NlpD
MSLNDSTKEEPNKIFKKIKSALSEGQSIIRNKINDIRIEKLSKLSTKAKIGAGVGLLCVAVLSSALVLMNMGPEVYAVNVEGRHAGYVSEAEIVEQIVEEIKTDLARDTKELEVIFDREALSVQLADVNSKDIDLLTNKELKSKLIAAELCKVNAWIVSIDGNQILAATSKEEADKVLSGVKEHYQTKGSEVLSIGFKEDVVVTQSAVKAAEIMEPEEAVSLILTGSREPKVYTVEEGDTVWDIAVANGMTCEDLENANPGFNPERLKIGQQLNLFEVKPYVTIQMTEILTATEKIDYDTVYEPTNTLYKGQVKVKTPGKHGLKEVKTQVTKENGVIVDSHQVASVVKSEPVNQVALRGTKSIATFTGSGTLSKPMSNMQLSSAFGSRGGGRHTGADFRNPKGTPIYAADDGVVTFAGYSGSYGNIVKLSHGNGLETWYAHCDKMSVSVGQTVSKGQTIATVGITGRATGYHLHFEVRKSGVPQNPMNYL